MMLFFHFTVKHVDSHSPILQAVNTINRLVSRPVLSHLDFWNVRVILMNQTVIHREGVHRYTLNCDWFVEMRYISYLNFPRKISCHIPRTNVSAILWNHARCTASRTVRVSLRNIMEIEMVATSQIARLYFSYSRKRGESRMHNTL